MTDKPSTGEPVVTQADRDLHMWLTGKPLDEQDDETKQKVISHRLAHQPGEIWRVDCCASNDELEFYFTSESECDAFMRARPNGVEVTHIFRGLQITAADALAAIEEALSDHEGE